MRSQCVAARKNTEVLQNNGFEQGSHEFVRWGSDLLQAVDIGFREYSALAGNFVKLDPVVFLFAEFLRRNFQFGIDLVDDCACAASALIIHRGNLLLTPGLVIILKDNDLGILSTQL